jgi:hypothetical protein
MRREDVREDEFRAGSGGDLAEPGERREDSPAMRFEGVEGRRLRAEMCEGSERPQLGLEFAEAFGRCDEAFQMHHLRCAVTGLEAVDRVPVRAERFEDGIELDLLSEKSELLFRLRGVLPLLLLYVIEAQ